MGAGTKPKACEDGSTLTLETAGGPVLICQHCGIHVAAKVATDPFCGFAANCKLPPRWTGNGRSIDFLLALKDEASSA